MNNFDKKNPAHAAYGVLIFALIVPAIIFRGFVLSTLWAWFMVPLGVIGIGIVNAIGLSVIVGMFTSNLAKISDIRKAENPRKALEIFLKMSFGAPAFALLMGFIVHLFM